MATNKLMNQIKKHIENNSRKYSWGIESHEVLNVEWNGFRYLSARYAFEPGGPTSEDYSTVEIRVENSDYGSEYKMKLKFSFDSIAHEDKHYWKNLIWKNAEGIDNFKKAWSDALMIIDYLNVDKVDLLKNMNFSDDWEEEKVKECMA